MTKQYYLAARPETIVSIIHNRRLPENLKEKFSYINQKKLEFFETPEAASAHSDIINKNTYILEYELPESSTVYTIEHDPIKASTKIICDHIDDKAILKNIYVYNRVAFNTSNRLLNQKSPVDVSIRPDLYSETKLVENKTKVEEIIATPLTQIQCLKTGDLLGSKMQTLVNTVNCGGVMGKGIAFAFKERYPEMFDDYKKRCNKKTVKLGEPYLYKVNSNSEKQIINFPTKGHWKNNSCIEDIESGLKHLAEHAKEWNIKSLAIPPLGCGNGGLDWEKVCPLIFKYLSPLEIPIEVYEPFEKINSKNDKNKNKRLSIFFEKLKEGDATKRPKLEISNQTTIRYTYDSKLSSLIAYHEGFKRSIGCADIVKEGDDYWLSHIEVNESWDRKKIATQLIAEAIALFPKLQIPLISTKINYGKYKYKLSEDDDTLIEHCIAQGIINKAINCVIPMPQFSKEELRNL